jgi:pimeloyl-ACP methyl ester carboxylesterase
MIASPTAIAHATPALSERAAASEPANARAGDQALGAATSGRAVVVIEGGGTPHSYSTPWDACDSGRPVFVQSMIDAGLPVFTAPGFGNLLGSTFGKTGCPPQPPLDVQWNTSGNPTQTGQAELGFLGYLQATYGYTTFDLVGYSYGGLVARATVSALKKPPAAGTMAPAFSYAQGAIDAGVSIPSVTTLNTPHLGGPAYDIAADPAVSFGPVAKAWGRQFATSSMSLVKFARLTSAGSTQVLVTSAHAKPKPDSWDSLQVGMLDDVALTLIAGDYCGRTCGDTAAGRAGNAFPRTDGTVPLYSQLMLPCPKICPAPPGSVYIPPGMVPESTVVRKTFPTVHSTPLADGLGLSASLSVSQNPAAIAYLVSTVAAKWQAAGIPLVTPQPA